MSFEKTNNTDFFYEKLGYEQLIQCSDILDLYPEYQELKEIGADKVYFSGDFPAILFKDIKSFNSDSLKEIADIQHKAWNYRKIMFLFAMSETEIRIYNCYETPKYIKPDSDYTKEIEPYQIFRSTQDDETNLKILVEIFSQIGVDCGLLWTSNYSEIREKIDIQKRIDRYLVQSLLNTAEVLKKDIGDPKIIHGLLMRSLFILYLEDKGAAKEAGLYEEIQAGADSYFKILEDKDATYRLFAKLQEHFNGNVFPVIDGEQFIVEEKHLAKIKQCFIDGDISEQPKLFNDWRIFKFDFIQIELLSEVYENFLGELQSKKEKGQFYTPYTLVELILNDKLPTKNETNHDVKILDPACGSGIFLVESYKRLIRRRKNRNPQKTITFNELQDILVKNIYGIENDELAIKVTAFSLYLALVEHLNPKKLWIDKDNQFPYLINNSKDKSLEGKQGKNLWCRDTIGEINPDEFKKVNLVIGNPPFGSKIAPGSIKDYCTKYKFGVDMVIPFIHKSVDFCPDGEIALIFNTKVLTNTEKPFQNFRKWLFQENYVEKVYNLSIFRKVPKNFGGQLFSSAIGPVGIVYFQKQPPEKISETIEYLAPKTYIKSNLIDGVLIDSTDIKYLPRTECQIPNTKIWKIAMWGNLSDFNLITNIYKSRLDLKTFFKRNNWICGAGLNGDSKRKDFIPTPILPVKSIARYYTPSNRSFPNNDYYRKIKNNDLLFTPPFVVIKKGQKDKSITASYINYNTYCKSGGFIINKKGSYSLDVKKVLVSFINSDIVTYLLFLSSSSWGIEREQVMLKEYLELPAFFENNHNLNSVTDIFDEIISELNQDFPSLQLVAQKERNINTQLLNILGLTEKEQILIQDTLQYNLDLFENGVKSKAFHRTILNENMAYAEMLSQELNDFYSESNHKISITIYDIQHSAPLNLVVLHFDNPEKQIEVKSAGELTPLLKKIDKYSIEEKGKNLYVQKQFRYYDYDKIYLIKPNQKRFWTRAQAIDDALSLIIEIANMGGRR